MEHTSEKVSVRATLTIRNDALISARERLGLTQKQAAELADVPLQALTNLEKFDFSKFVELQRYAERISEAFEIPISKIFADGLAGKRIDSKIVKTVQCSSRQLESLSQSGRRLSGSPLQLEAPVDPGEINRELASRLDQVLKTLSFREREVLKLRYGIGEKDGFTYTLGETARIFKVTRERIRQVESKAIRKLQNPVRSAKLDSFVPMVDTYEDLVLAAKKHESAKDFAKALDLIGKAKGAIHFQDTRRGLLEDWMEEINEKIAP